MTTFNDVLEAIEEKAREGEKWREQQEERFKAMEQYITKSQRPLLDGGISFGGSASEQKALNGAVRALIAGQQEKANQLFTEAKAMIAGSGPDGGYVVHDQLSTGMTTIMAQLSPIYRLSRKIRMTHGTTFEEAIDKDNAQAAWVGEVDARNDTITPQLGKLSIDLHEIYAMPKASQTLVDQADIDVLAWLRDKVGTAFAMTESAAFHTGTGIARPYGILNYPTAALGDDTRTWGTIEHVVTGASGAFHTDKADCLHNVVSKLKPQYRAGAVWLMNRKTANVIRKLKEATTEAYIWQPGLQLGQPDSLMGYRVEIDEDMPDIGANSLSIAFGNFEKAYTIIEMPGAKFLTDPYTDKPNVRLYAYRRVGGAVNNPEAYKLLKFSA